MSGEISSQRLEVGLGRLRRYGLAVAAVAAAVLLRQGIPSVLEDTPFLAFYPAVVVAAVLGGAGPGVAAAVASAISVGLLFDPTPGWEHLHEPAVLVRLGLFLVGGVGTSLAVGSIRASRADARQRAAALRESEWRFRGTFENAAVGMSHTDLQGRWLRVNQKLCDMFDYSREELLGRSFPQITHPDDLEADWQQYQRMIRGEIDHYHVEKRYLNKIGQTAWVRISRSIQHDAAGRPAYSINVVEDITAHKQAEEKQRSAAEELQTVMDAAPVGILVAHDPQSRKITGNRRAYEILGVPIGENLSATSGDRQTPVPFRIRRAGQELAPEDLPIQVACATGNPVRGEELEVVHENGARRIILITVAPLRSSTGAVRGAVATIADITDRKRAEQRMRLQAAALEAAANGITITDSQGTMLWANDALCQMTGYRREELIGRNPRVFNSGHQDQAFYQKLWQTILGGEAWHGEIVNRRKDGSEYVEEMTISPLRDDRDQIVNFIAVKQDVSARKAQEQALVAARRAADEASRAKDHFLAVLSHELRNPLTPVLATAAMLQRDPAVRGDLGEHIEVIRRNAELEARLIDDLLDVTRIARGKVELIKERADLCTVINRAIEVCKPDIEGRGIHFGIDWGPRPYWVDADVGRMQQVFWNLFNNAIKFTPHGGCVSVKCRCNPDGGHVIAEVTDSGIGIPPEMLPAIFNPFEQAERSITRQFGGLGLGLTICKAIVELHGGAIEAHSEGRGKGATLRVHLPLQAPALPPGPAPQPGKPEPKAAHPLRILVVEDHGDTARIMQRMLRLDGHDVAVAGDIATALHLMEERAFDLLLSDLGLPDGSGVDLMRTLREHGRMLPGIALSGFGQEEDIRRSREAGFAAHLTKPTNPDLLTRTISTVTRPGATD